MVDVGLVVCKEGEFLFGEAVRLEGDFEAVSGLDVWFQVLLLGFVDGAEEVKGIILAFLFSRFRSVSNSTP